MAPKGRLKPTSGPKASGRSAASHLETAPRVPNMCSAAHVVSNVLVLVVGVECGTVGGAVAPACTRRSDSRAIA